MRALLTLCVLSAVAARALGATCGQVTGGSLYASATSCTAFTACGSTFCTCVSSTSTSASSCLASAPNTTTCATIETCMKAYTMCIERVPHSSTGCSALNSTLKMSFMAASASGYAGSSLQKSCNNRACAMLNHSTASCAFASNSSNVCMWRPVPSALNATTTAAAVATTAAPPTSAAPAGFVPAMRAEIEVAGTFTGILGNTSARGRLETAVKTDLTTFFSVAQETMHVYSMRSGSLIVDFGVSTAGGVPVADLTTRLNQAQGQLAFTATQTLYNEFESGQLSVSAVSVKVTAPPGSVTTPPPTPPTTTSASAGVVTAVAAAFAAVAAVAAL